MKYKLLSTLGLCRKAGKLVTGFEAVCEAGQKGKLSIIMVAADLSAKSRKEIAFAAKKHNLELVPIPVSMEEIKSVLGKRTGILGISDPGLSNTLKHTASRVNEEE